MLVQLALKFLVVALLLLTTSSLLVSGHGTEQDPDGWCRHYRSPTTKRLDQAYQLGPLVEHLNEDLKMAIKTGHGHSHDDPSPEEVQAERNAVFKGLVALAGIFVFFIAEKILGFVSEYRAEKKLMEEDQKRALQGSRPSTGGVGVRRLSTYQPSVGQLPNTLAVPGQQQRRISQLDPSVCRRASRAMSIVNEDILTTGLSSKAMRSIDILYRYAEEDALADAEANQDGDSGTIQLPACTKSIEKHEDGSHKELDAGKQSSKKQKGGSGEPSLSLAVPTINVIGDSKHDESGQHHHDSSDKEVEETHKQHGHGHSHGVPGSVASVAWMVIMGDGLHNFTDGMAIGAAFAQSMSGGLSTTVAVFCHELPHELGDFAVLLKTGMRIKEALFFNVVSSILSLLGLLVGIAAGNVQSASYWIFAITAGTFIYIALVDMLPELSTAELKPGQTRVGQIVIQTIGLATGVGIMLLIAIYEDKIRVFVD